MKTLYLLLALAITVAGEHDHQGEANATTALTLNHGKRWPAEGASLKGMGKIREIMAARIEAIHEGKAKKADFSQAAGLVDAELSQMFKDCKHSPGADQVFHRLLSKIIVGNSKMKRGPIAARREGALDILSALGDYPNYFDHPGWEPLAH